MPEVPFLRQWIDVVRRARLGRTVTAVATMLATYADPDGTRVFPGVARLSFECELSYTSIKDTLRTLRKLGLIDKVGRRGDADEYRLILHEDLLERVNLPTPSEANEAIVRIRKVWKGNYTPGLRSTRTPAEDGERECLRSAAPPAENPLNDRSAVGGSDTVDESAVGGSDSLRSAAPTATYQDHITTDTNHSDKDLRTDLAATRAREAENEDPNTKVLASSIEPRVNNHGSAPSAIFIAPATPRVNNHGKPDGNIGECLQPQAEAAVENPTGSLREQPRSGTCPHGRSIRRTKSGHLRCPDCRTTEENPPTPDECSHGVKSRYRCPACERGLTGGDP